MNDFSLSELHRQLTELDMDKILELAEKEKVKAEGELHNLKDAGMKQLENVKRTAENKISLLQNQLMNRTREIRDLFNGKVEVIFSHFSGIKLLLQYYVSKGKQWCRNNINFIKIKIGSILQKINDMILVVVDWVKKQIKAVEKWVKKQIDVVNSVVAAQKTAVENFIKEQAEKAAKTLAELEIKKLTVK